MSIFNEISDTINSRIQEYKDAQEKYSAYRKVDVHHLTDFHEPQNDSQKALAKKAGGSALPLVLFVSAVLILTGIYMFITVDSSARAAFLVFTALGLLIMGFALASHFSKCLVLEGGKAAFKHTRRSHSGKHRSTMYLVTVYFDHPEKIIVPEIQITRGEYFDVVEGTPILIIKKGILYFARIDR